jgi:hypothetical protein
MPVTRCPRCAHRQVVAAEVIGEIVGCPRCERTFPAVALSGVGRARDLLMVLAALVVGGVVAWLLLVRGGA